MRIFLPAASLTERVREISQKSALQLFDRVDLVGSRLMRMFLPAASERRWLGRSRFSADSTRLVLRELRRSKKWSRSDIWMCVCVCV